MMRMGRPGFGILMILVATAMVTGSFRAAGSYGGWSPAGVGTIQIVLLVAAMIGIAVLGTKYLIGNSERSTVDTTSPANTEAALETLKKRYASGKIDEIEFERKLELLFETETVADAERRVENRPVPEERSSRVVTPSETEERYAPPADRPSKRPERRSRRGHCK